MNELFINNKWIMFTVAILMAAAGYWQSIHLEAWSQIFSFQNFIGLILVLGGLILGNHTKSIFVGTPPKQ